MSEPGGGQVAEVGRVYVCDVAALPPGTARRVEVDPPIAVFNVDGEFFATSDTCTHDKTSLADGFVDGDQVECPWHFATFCVRTGAALTPPAYQPLRTYSVEIDGDRVYVHPGPGVS